MNVSEKLSGNAGNINISTSDIVSLDSDSSINSSSSFGKGNAGNIGISSRTLSLAGGAQISSSTFGTGNAGNVTINADDTVKLSNTVAIFSNVERGAVGNGGKIDITAKSLSLDNGAQLAAIVRGKNNSLAGGKGDAGDINLNIAETITISGQFQQGNDVFFSGLSSIVEKGAEGQGGDINIKTRNLSLADDAAIDSSTFGIGNAGNITITTDNSLSIDSGTQISSSTFGTGNAGNVVVIADDAVKLSNTAAIFSTVGRGAVGNGGKIDITAKSLSLDNGAQLQTLVRGKSDSLAGGKGDAGDINLNIADTITISGQFQQDNDVFSSGIGSAILEGAEGKGGDINVKTRNLSLADGGFIDNSTSGIGNAGNITINADDAVTLSNADILSNVESGAVRNGGKIDITAKSLSLDNGARITTEAFQDGDAGNINISTSDIVSLDSDSSIDSSSGSGKGNAGNIGISSRTLSLAGGAQISSSTFGKGDAGNITVNATDNISLNGKGSAILSQVEEGAEGNGGQVKIDTGSLNLTNGAQIDSSTSGKGNAGNITVNASDNISINGTSSDSQFSSAILSTVNAGAEGNGGEVKIETGFLNLKGGGQIQTLVRQADPENKLPAGKGDAGKVIINARDAVTLDGRSSDGKFPSAIFSELGTGAVGKADNIDITTGNISLTNGGLISSGSFGIGDGGNITINFKDTLKLRGGGLISAQAVGEANAGNININSPDGFIVAFPGDNNIIATATQQQGGNISIDVNKVYGFDRSRIQKILSLEDRERILNDGENDINSTSDKPELSGDINLNTDILDPAKERVKTNEQAIEPDNTVSQACSGSGDIAKANSFTITGRGGLPTDPTQPLNSSILAGSLGAEEQKSGGAEERRSRGEAIGLDGKKKTFYSDEIIPARGVAVNEKGQVVLTRYPTPNASQRNASESNYCTSSLQQQELSATNTASDRPQETLDPALVEALMRDLAYYKNSVK
jgi:large exoprotein involved in heme utilization and adhesion